MNKNRKQSALRALLIIAAIALAAELLVFNFRHWESLGYAREELSEYDGTVLPLDGKKNTLELSDIDRVVNNLYLECEVLGKDGSVWPWQALEITYEGRDDANAMYFKMGARRILTTVPRMRYARINLLGRTKALRLSFASDHDDAAAVRVARLALNAPVPLFISPLRLVAVAALLLLAWLLRPASGIYRTRFEEVWRGRRLAVAATCLLLCAVLCAFVYVEGAFADSQEANTQHHYLAHALAKGQVYLDIEPSQALLDMDNPYDARLRRKLVGEKNFKRDFAFYEGRYYSYFGALPAATLYLPWYLLTGRDMHATTAHLIYGLLMTLGLCALLYRLFRVRFARAPFVLYPLSCAALLFCSGLYYAFRATKMYTLPIICAMALSAWGLWCWLGAGWLESSRARRLVRTALGSLLIALTVQARPQFIFTSLFVFPLFASQFRALIRRKPDWRFWLALLLPVIPVAAVTMLYNRARFGSPFDFGATYNLCSGDMRVRGWHWDRVGLALYGYLLAPVITTPVFPFLTHNAITNGYLGTTICENAEIYGGLFALMPGAAMCLANFKRRRPQTPEDGMVLGMGRLAVALALGVLVLDAQVAGIVFRYRMDFGWLICLSALIWLLRVESDADAPDWLTRAVRVALPLSLLVGFAFELLALFTHSSIEMWWHPRLYYGLKALMEFWA